MFKNNKIVAKMYILLKLNKSHRLKKAKHSKASTEI